MRRLFGRGKEKSPEVLFAATSPNGNVHAGVEQDERVAYFYLRGPQPQFGTKACWVRNLGKAPRELDADGMLKGVPPMLSEEYCTHPEGAPPLISSLLRVVWLEEGDAAALFEENELLAVIPSWSAPPDFYGYARDCRGQSPLCWALGNRDTNVLFDRITRAQEFWDSWNPDTWPRMCDELVELLEKGLGRRSSYFAIDGGKWPPKAMLQIPVSDGTVFVTLGVSIRPQPKVETASDDTDKPETPRRIELGIGLGPEFSEKEMSQGYKYLSWLTAFPWSQYAWLGHGHTVECDAIPKGSRGEKFSAVVLVKNPQGAPEIEFPRFRGDAVNLLWMIPITANERQFAVKNSSEELVKRLATAGHGWIHHGRRELPLI